jgi:hypothetical protein
MCPNLDFGFCRVLALAYPNFLGTKGFVVFSRKKGFVSRCYCLIFTEFKFVQVSVGYFITDLAMILWAYPSLGGMEYVSEYIRSLTYFLSYISLLPVSTSFIYKYMLI